MIPTYLYSSSSTSASVDPSKDHEQLHFYTAKASSSSPFSSHFFNCPIQNQEANNFVPSNDPEIVDQGLRLSLWNKGDEHHDQNQGDQGWMPSKMRLIRKMMTKSNRAVKGAPEAHTQPVKLEDQLKAQQPASPLQAVGTSSSNSSSNINSPIRVCSDCNTTKTPLWRSGPRGPKSLCNACGIRQRKARRAMAAAAAAAGGTVLMAETPVPVKTKVQIKDKRPSQLKKQPKLAALSHNNGRKTRPSFEDFLLNLSKNLPFYQVFPQDEKEAAILLMALSCGLVHG
ncbi:hypothetical protein NMG60_11013628 [Bertholletia excelsa]